MGKYTELLKVVQSDLKGMGMYSGAIDGIPGAKTSAGFNALCDRALDEYHTAQDLKGNGTIKGTIGDFKVIIDGDDLVVKNVRCTCFGGSADSMDSGQTASGYPTKGHHDLMAVALPMNYNGPDRATKAALHGSPIPHMPFGLHSDGRANPDGAWVKIKFANGKEFLVPCIDLGPNIAKYPKNAIDATIALAKQANPNATANNFEATVDYRIMNGAKFI